MIDPLTKPALDLQLFKQELFVLYRRLIQSGAWTKPDWEFSKLIWTIWIEAKDCKEPAPFQTPSSPPPCEPTLEPAAPGSTPLCVVERRSGEGAADELLGKALELKEQDGQDRSSPIIELMEQLRRNRRNDEEQP